MFDVPGTRLLTLVLLLLAVGGVADAKVYKWVDSNGRVHYSEKPPPEAKDAAKQVEIREGPTGVGGPIRKPKGEAAAPAEDLAPEWEQCKVALCARAKRVEQPECGEMCRQGITLTKTCAEKSRIVCAGKTSDYRKALAKAEQSSSDATLKEARKKAYNDYRKAKTPTGRDRAIKQYMSLCSKEGRRRADCERDVDWSGG
ncbi:MAG: DUF4124 domain-containing protein [Pseudomonadota bacterium]